MSELGLAGRRQCTLTIVLDETAHCAAAFGMLRVLPAPPMFCASLAHLLPRHSPLLHFAATLPACFCSSSWLLPQPSRGKDIRNASCITGKLQRD